MMDKNEGIFPVRPRPISDESFIGYVLRVALANGRSTLSALCAAIGLPRRKLNQTIGPRDNLFSALASKLKLDNSFLSNHFAKEDAHSYEESRSLKNIKINHPKICLKCVSETGYLKSTWQEIYFTHCPEHKILLTDACPHCRTELTWTTNLFEKCSFCHIKWSEVKVPASPLPNYQTLGADQNSLRALIDAFVITLRPWDLMHETLQTIDIPNSVAHSHFQQAYSLLTDSKYRSEWINYYSCKEIPFAKRLVKNMEAADYLEKIQLESCASVLFESPYLPLFDIGEAASDRRKKLATTDLDLRMQIGIYEASRLLSITKPDLYFLLDKKIFGLLKDEQLERNYLFDARDVNKINVWLLTKSKAINDSIQLRQIKELLGSLKHFHFSQGQLLYLLLTDNITIYATESTTHWHEIYVNPISFFKWLDSIFRNFLPSIITPELIYQIAGLNWQQYITVLKLDNGDPSIMDQKFFSSDSIISFLKRYIVLNRITYIHGISTKVLHNMLLKHNLMPAHQLVDRKIVYIYDNIPSTAEIIDRSINEMLTQ